MPMSRRSHVAQEIRAKVFRPLGLSLSEGAIALGVSRLALAELLEERAPLTIEMALRIEKAFGLRMEPLMRAQLEYEMTEARAHADNIKVGPYKASHTDPNWTPQETNQRPSGWKLWR